VKPRLGTSRVRQRWTRFTAAASLLVMTGLFVGPAAPANASDAVSKSKTVARYYVEADGTKKSIDSRSVKLTVDHTTNLRSLQLVHVSWSGARPTAGIVGDQNSDLAQNEEYPMVLLECRGVDSTSAPPGQRLSPETCWTLYADERFSYGYDSWPAWRSDAEAAKAERAPFVNAPTGKSLPLECANALNGTSNQRWVPFRGANGETFRGGISGCAGQAPEAIPDNLSSLSLPSNETFGVTGLDGKGEANFDVFTGEDHNSLGCSQTVACALVAIPVMGVSCDANGLRLPAAQRPVGSDIDDARAACETDGNFKPGTAIPPQKSGADAVDGRLWWSASNWNNRITVPLTFAAPDNACGLANASTPVAVYGSELLTQATTQWAPTFCLNPKLFNFNHVQTPEPQAATLLNNGSIGAAFVSRPPDGGWSSPTVMAPVALSGFGIAFDVDDANGNPVVHLKLTARLLAKLLTESYPDLPDVRDTHTYTTSKGRVRLDLVNNPLNIAMDPEFRALNPNIPQKIKDSAATLLTVSSDSDVMYALTSYIEADPVARQWLDGAADPWGMTVNPRYKGIDLPTASWPLLDDFKPAFSFGTNPCFWSNPVPYLPLVAAPTARLFSIGQAMQFSIAQSQTTCVTPSPDPTSLAGAKVVAQGRQQAGARFMLGVVSLGDAAREGLNLAGLETYSAAKDDDQFTDDSGRTFAEPTITSLRTAAALLKPSVTPGVKDWVLDDRDLRSLANAKAYPGTMVVYAAVETKGLSASDAKNYSTLLDYAATTLQRPGAGIGRLPGGYLPLTSTYGLGTQAYYARVAAQAVGSQTGAVPDLDARLIPPPAVTPPSSAPASTPATSPVAPPPAAGTVPSGSGPTTPATASGPPSSPKAGTSSRVLTTPSLSQAAQETSVVNAGKGALIVPVLAGLALLAGIGSVVVRIRGRAGGHS